MKKIIKLVSVLIFTIVCLFFSTTVVFSQQSAGELYEKALYAEEVKGELQNAIDLYQQLLENNPENKQLAAKALLHQGMCYEKLGNQEAVKKYQNLVDNYPGQKNEVALARERLSKLLAAEKELNAPLEPKFTKIKIPTKLSWNVALSPDGKNLALVSESKLWVMPLSGNIGPGFPGKPVQVNTEGVTVEWSGLTWSGDGKWIAFNEETIDKTRSERPEKEKFNQRIFVVPSNGGKPKQVIENYRSARVVNYRISLSPEGKNLAYSSIENNKQHVYTTQVAGGTPKQLVEIQSREPVFSPNGEMIAFVEDKNMGSGAGGLGLWVIPSQGETPQLLAEAETASSPVWSPDGTMIAFLDNSMNKQIYFVQVPKDKETTGNVTSINTPEEIEEVRLLAGWTPENKIGVLMTSKNEFALYTLPATGGQAAIISNDCYASQPRWSRDGKQVFYSTIPKEGVNRFYQWFIASVPAVGGTGHPLLKDDEDKNIHFISYQGGNRISPDGKWIISSVWTPADSGGNYPRTKVWKIAVDGSKSMQITNNQGPYADMCPSWSPEGTKIAFIRTRLTGDDITFGSASMHTMNISGGDMKMLLPESDKYIFSPVWSPDGKMIAYLTADLPSGTNPTINVVNVSTGEVNVIGKLPVAHIHIELAWSPDSKQIAFNGDNVIKIMNIEDGKIEDIKTNLIDVDIWHLDWSPDGKQFVFAGSKGGEAEFWFLENFLPMKKKIINRNEVNEK